MGVSNLPGAPNVNLTQQLQECFAVRPDVDGMLDVARKTFLQSMEDIYQTADSMTEENGYHVKVIKRVRMYCHFSHFDRPAASRVHAWSFHLATATTV